MQVWKVGRSHDALLVVFEFHDKWLDVLALALPLADTLLCVGVEVFLLLVQKGLSLHGCLLLFLELLNLGLVLL